MKYIIKKQFGRAASVMLALLMVLGSIPHTLSVGVTENVAYGQSIDHELLTIVDINEYDAEYLYDYDYDNYLVTQWHSFGGHIVICEQYTPLHNAEISLFYRDYLSARVLTDEQGRYFISAMAFDVETLVYWSMTVAYEGFETEYVSLSDFIDPVLLQSNVVHIDASFMLEEYAQPDWDGSVGIRGIFVSYETGTPIDGAAVELIGGDGSVFTAITDVYGFYEILISPESEERFIDFSSLLLGAVITASREGYFPETIYVDDYVGYIDVNGRVDINSELNSLPYTSETPASDEETVTSEYDTAEDGAEDTQPEYDAAEEDAEDSYPEYDTDGEDTEEFQPEDVSELERAPRTYTIGNAGQLQQFLMGQMGTNQDYFIVTQSISMAGQPATPGRGHVLGQPFTGSFSGINSSVTITGLQLRPSTEDERIAGAGQPINDVGFIRILGDGARINNINFVNITYNDTENIPEWNTAIGNIGFLAGRVLPGAAVYIENVDITGTAAITRPNNATYTNKRFGGMIGHAESGGLISIVDFDITMGISIGGLAPSSINRSIPAVGGVIGSAASGIEIGVENRTTNNVSLTTGVVNGERNHFHNIGGVIGNSINTAVGAVIIDSVHVIGGTVSPSLSTLAPGSTTDNHGVGGIFGSVGSASITNSRIHPAVTLRSQRNVGGIVGRATGVVNITNSHNMLPGETGSTIAPLRGHGTGNNAMVPVNLRARGVGGIVGRITVTGNVTLDGVSNASDIITVMDNASSQTGHFGGIVGRTQGSLTINNSTNRGAIQGFYGVGTGSIFWGSRNQNTDGSVGGILGNANNSVVHINSTTNYGGVRSQSRIGTGGIVGSTAGSGSTVLDNVENRATIIRTNRHTIRVGGLIGWSRNPMTITNSGNHGNVLVYSYNNIGGNGAGTSAIQMLGGLIGQSCQSVIIYRSDNRGHVVNSMNRVARIGGIIGYSRHGVTMSYVDNHGVVAARPPTVRSAQGEAAFNHGGIIGRVDFNAARAAADRTVNMTSVRNFADVGPTTPPPGTLTFLNENRTAAAHAGGVIGFIRSRSGTNVNLRNVTNQGNVRGGINSGGLVGWNNTLNLAISQSGNYGAVTSLRNNSNAGGIVARNGRNGLIIRDSFNEGSVTTLGARLAMNPGRSWGTGGIVGNVTLGTAQVLTSYNIGAIHGTGEGVGGIVGRSGGSGRLIIQDVYNLGTVTTVTTSGTSAAALRSQRSGNGILGRRSGGPVEITRVFNAGRVEGRPIYMNPSVTPNARVQIGTYMNFNRVYWDTSVHAGQGHEQVIARGSIVGVPTDLLTRGLLPGLSWFDGANWLSGTIPRNHQWFVDNDRLDLIGPEGELLQTYPFLRWQTGGSRDLQFVYGITDPGNVPVVDLLGAGHRTSHFRVWPDRLPYAMRYFMPYEGAEITTPRHFGPVLSETSSVIFPRNGPMSLGVLNHNNVTAFDVRDRSGVVVMAVDALYYEMGEIEPIDWAEFFDAAGLPIESHGSMIIIEGLHVAEQIISIRALGYAPINNRVLSLNDIENGMIIIPMNRVAIQNVRVEIRDMSDEAENPRLVPNSFLRHFSPFVPADLSVPALPNPGGRHFILPVVYWGDLLTGSAVGFMHETISLSFGDFISGSGTIADPWVVIILLDPITVRDLRLNVVEVEQYIDSDGDESERYAGIVHGGTANNFVQVALRNPEGLLTANPPTATRQTGFGASPYRWNLTNLTRYTFIEVTAEGFWPSPIGDDAYQIQDLMEYDDEGVALQDIFVVMDRKLEINIRVVEHIPTGEYELDPYGEPVPVFDVVEIPLAQVIHPYYHPNFPVISGRPGAYRFQAITRDGDSLIISAPDFTSEVFVVDITDEGWTRAARRMHRYETIVLERIILPCPMLTLTNIPGNLTHIDQSGVAGTTALAFNGLPATVSTDTSVSLTAGEVAQNHYFLGWYRYGGEGVPTVGTLISDLESSRFVSAESHVFSMPETDTQYFALWGAGGTVGAYAARITFHVYGAGMFMVDGYKTEEIVIPVNFDDIGRATMNLSVIAEYLNYLDDEFAFWGWFTGEALDYERRISTRTGNRRPIVGATNPAHMPFEHITVDTVADPVQVTLAVDPHTLIITLTETAFFDIADDGNIDLFAIWSLWGDVDDNDVVDLVDANLLFQHARGAYPPPVINLAPGDVHRDGIVDLVDANVVFQYARGASPRPLLGARPTGIEDAALILEEDVQKPEEPTEDKQPEEAESPDTEYPQKPEDDS